MPSSTLRNATDAHVTKVKPGRNYGKQATLHMQAGERFSYIYFNRAAPLGATITKATLRLYRGAVWPASSTRTVTVRRVSASWAESRLRWNNRPGVTGVAAVGSAPGGVRGTFVEIDVTALMQSVSNGAAWYGFRLETNETWPRWFVSSEGVAAYRPTLEVTWSDQPQAPTTLSPSGERAVSTAKPVLSFDFTDELGDTSLQAVQVQLDAAANWVAPSYDSGWVLADVPELDLSRDDIPTYAGLANNASTYWRVRVRDGAGLVSEWSDDELFKRVDLPAVTIQNPPASAVYEPTPPILWSFAGTQTAFQVVITDASDPSVVIVDSSKQTSDETAWTVPARKLTRRDYPYKLEVRLFDDVEREAVGEPIYSSAERVFTVQADSSVTGVSSLAAVQPEPKPRTRLTFSRSTAPDSFVVRRDGLVVEDELLPEDALISGTSYVYEDDNAAVWRAHTWQITAVVNGHESSASSVVFTPKQRGIWLLDRERGREVWLAGNDDGSFARGEDATVFVPIGANRVVRRVQGQRGYEGSLSGVLVDAHGRTAHEYEADLLAMREEPSRPVVLSLADMSIRVILGSVNTAPTQHVPPSRLASFEFWESSE